jgi:nucleoid-associated protein YgaU
MRDRTSLLLFVVILLLIIILAQNGLLGSLFSGNSSGSMAPTLPPSVRPLTFATPTPKNQLLPPPNLPTVYLPPTYLPAYPPPTAQQAPAGNQPPVYSPGSVSAGGQCVVPNGWVAYTVQPGDTLAVIAASFGLTAEQLAQANCLQNPDLIYEGQVLAVPGTR